MFLSFYVASIENALITIAASNVILMRLQMFTKGDTPALREAELTLSEKLDAFTQASFDIMAGASNAVIRKSFRTAIQANEVRLRALRVAA